MSFKDFQDGHQGSHLGYWNGMILAILNLYVPLMPHIKFWLNQTYSLWGDVVILWHLGYRNRMNIAILNLHVSPVSPPSFDLIQLTVQEQMLFEVFQDGHHGGHLLHWNKRILVIQNLYITLMPPIKFQLNSTYGLGGDVVLRILRWPPWWPALILEWKEFSNSESQGLPMPPTKFRLYPTYGSRGDVVWRFSRWRPWQPSWTLEQNHFKNSKSPCSPNASHQVSAQSDLRFWRRCRKCEKLMTDGPERMDDRQQATA